MAGAAVGADSINSSVTFLVSGSAESPQLRSAWHWARRIADPHGPGAAVLTATSVHALWPMLAARNRELIAADLPKALRDQRFGRLTGHNLVWLFGGARLALVEKPSAEAVLPLNARRLDPRQPAAPSELAAELETLQLSAAILDSMKRAGDGRIETKDASKATRVAWSTALSLLATGFFRQLHLVPVGSQAAVGGLAQKLAALTGVDVTWNTHALMFRESPAPRVEDREVDTDEDRQAVKVIHGEAFFGGGDVEIKAEADTFLPGAEHRVEGKAP